MKHTMHKMIFILFIATSVGAHARGAGPGAGGMQGQGMSRGSGQMQHDRMPQYQISPRPNSENFQNREMLQEEHQIRQMNPDRGFEYQEQYRELNKFGQEK